MKKSYIDAMKSRRSVRTFGRREMSHMAEGQLRDYIRYVEHPFDAHVRFELVATDNNSAGRHLGTYGIIQNARHYIVGVTDRSAFAMETLGYTFEKVILKATMLGLATCWLGGTFNKGAFADAVMLGSDEVLPAVSPVGIKSSRPSVVARTMELATHQKRRKPFEELFFDQNWQTPLSVKRAGRLAVPLEMVRIAPSSRNCQPWRVLVDEKGIHFYQNGSKEMNRIDMGIALCHFELACREKKLKGGFEYRKVHPEEGKGMRYTLSWIPETT